MTRGEAAILGFGLRSRRKLFPVMRELAADLEKQVCAPYSHCRLPI